MAKKKAAPKKKAPPKKKAAEKAKPAPEQNGAATATEEPPSLIDRIEAVAKKCKPAFPTDAEPLEAVRDELIKLLEEAGLSRRGTAFAHLDRLEAFASKMLADQGDPTKGTGLLPRWLQGGQEELFDKRRPRALDLVSLKSAAAIDGFLTALVLAVNQDGDGPIHLALCPLSEISIPITPVLGHRRTLDDLLVDESAEDLGWVFYRDLEDEGVKAETLEFWRSWMRQGLPIKAERRHTARTLDDITAARDRLRDAKVDHEVAKEAAKKAKARYESATEALVQVIDDAETLPAWPWKEV